MPWFVERLADPRRAEFVTYRLDALLRTVLFGQGWRDQADADALRFDPALRFAAAVERGTTPLEDCRHVPSQPTLSRLLDILSSEGNRRVLREAIAELAGRRLRAERRGRCQRRLTIDVDSLPIEVQGAHPGSAWDGHYHQHMFHPIVASAAETGDFLDARLRPRAQGLPRRLLRGLPPRSAAPCLLPSRSPAATAGTQECCARSSALSV